VSGVLHSNYAVLMSTLIIIVFIRLLTALDCMPHEMVLKIDASRP